MTLFDELNGLEVTNHYNETFVFRYINGHWHRCFSETEKWTMTQASVLMTIKKFRPDLFNRIRKEYPEEFV